MLDINIKLKPCPFCGNDIKVNNLECSYFGINKLDIECEECHAEFSIDGGEPGDYHRFIHDYMSPVDIWNRRVTSTK